MPPLRRAFAPGRVNLIGEHTDYTGGLVLPIAVHLGTTVEIEAGGVEVVLSSVDETDQARVPIEVSDPASVSPAWARFVAGVVAEMRPAQGGAGEVRTTLPIGAGLSSSAALEVAVALALGFEGPALDLALLCQRAEQRASGVPCGIMDQLASAAGVEAHALLIDCHTLDVTPTRVPDELDVLVVDSGTRRQLATSFYGVRRAQCEEAETLIGPLREATLDDVEEIATDVLRHRARHVVTENLRVRDFAAALAAGDVVEAGRLMTASHASLRDDFEVSTHVLDDLVEHLRGRRGIHGARLTGAGFGGCVVALADPDADLGLPPGFEVWPVRPSRGATVELLED